MANGKVLRQIIKAGIAGDQNAFQRVSEAIIQEERQKQHHLLANDLEKILYGGAKKDYLHLAKLPESPKDKERGFDLLDVKQPSKSSEELIVGDRTNNHLQDFIEEHRRADVLKSYGLKPSDKTLFYGPPGCGKTLAAEVIAYELDRPLGIVRLDALVSSFLGETAANLRTIFDYISSVEMVILFDEFDAIGKERGDSSEHGELRRVVNAVLQMMDAYSGKSIILAATNHEKILDTAIWRRFDEAIFFDLPSGKEICEILRLKLRGVRRQFEINDPNVVYLFEGKSGADIERVLRRSIKKMILKNKEFLSITDIKVSVERDSF
ncbi:AAA family ATPase [Vreelandella venusta]|uniref:AAA family ATPase n=1 Tax=Vreelandella venusta TaxID=44935 RepID=UPI003AA8E083